MLRKLIYRSVSFCRTSKTAKNFGTFTQLINHLFRNQVIISNDFDLNLRKTTLGGDNFLPNLLTQHPDTKWKFFCVTNVTFVFLLSGVPLGCINHPVISILHRHPVVKCFVCLRW